MDSSVDFNPTIKFGMSMNYYSDSKPDKKMDDKIYTFARNYFVRTHPKYNDIIKHTNDNAKININISESENEKIGSLLRSLPNITYDQFVVRSAKLSTAAKLFLVNSINAMLYEYAYDYGHYNISNNEIFVAMQSMIKEMTENGSISKHLVADCTSISPFTAKFADDLGLGADAITVYNHAITPVRTKSQGIMIIDKNLFVTGTSNFYLAMTKYQAYTGELSPLTRIMSPSGEIRGIFRTIEGQLILNNMAGFGDPLMNAANSMKNPTLITEVKNNPTITISANASPSSIIGKAGIDGWFWNHLNLNTNLYVLDSSGDYNFGAIQKGLAGSFGTGIKFENNRYAFRLNGTYAKSYLDADKVSSESNSVRIDDTKANNIDVYRLSGIYLFSSALGRLSLKAGNEFSGVMITTKVKGEDMDGDGFLVTVPQASVFFPLKKGRSIYVGSAMPIEFLKGDFDDNFDASNIKLKLGAAFMAGGSMDLGLGMVGIDIMYKSDQYSDKIDINMNLRKGSSGPGGEIFYSKQWTNLEGYVPDDASVGVGATVAMRGFELGAKAVRSKEFWPGENRDYTSFLVTLTR